MKRENSSGTVYTENDDVEENAPRGRWNEIIRAIDTIIRDITNRLEKGYTCECATNDGLIFN